SAPTGRALPRCRARRPSLCAVLGGSLGADSEGARWARSSTRARCRAEKRFGDFGESLGEARPVVRFGDFATGRSHGVEPRTVFQHFEETRGGGLGRFCVEIVDARLESETADGGAA